MTEIHNVETAAGASREVVDIGRAMVSYQKTGDGPNLVFVHGWPFNGGTWRNVIPHLDGFTSYVIDLPGCGDTSATDRTPLTVRGHADAVVDFMDTLDLDEVVLVGQDSGGMMCRFAAEKRPGRVAGLVLLGSEVPGVHAPLVKLFKMLAKLPGSKAMFRLSMGNRFLAKTPLILGGTVYDKAFLDGEFRTRLLAPILADSDAMDAVVAMIQDFSFVDIDALEQVHANLTMPTLLVYGKDDGFFPVEKARSMAEQFGGPTEFVSISSSKLLVHEEHPKHVADLTRAFHARQVKTLSG